MTLRASVVVPAYNRPGLLERAISVLQYQSLPKKDFEIILVHGKDMDVALLCKKEAKRGNVSSFGGHTESQAKFKFNKYELMLYPALTFLKWLLYVPLWRHYVVAIK